VIHKPVKIGDDRTYPSLLEHDFGNPNLVGIFLISPG